MFELFGKDVSALDPAEQKRWREICEENYVRLTEKGIQLDGYFSSDDLALIAKVLQQPDRNS